MAERESRNLVALRAGKRFPEELWRKFRATVDAQGKKWIDVLRELIEGYVRDHENQTPHR